MKQRVYLDPEGRRELIDTVKGIRKDYDMTVISITHDLEEVAMVIVYWS